MVKLSEPTLHYTYIDGKSYLGDRHLTNFNLVQSSGGDFMQQSSSQEDKSSLPNLPLLSVSTENVLPNLKKSLSQMLRTNCFD